MERIYRNTHKPAANWIPHEYMLDSEEDADNLPTLGIPPGSTAYTVNESIVLRMGTDGAWHNVTLAVHPDSNVASPEETNEFLGI